MIISCVDVFFHVFEAVTTRLTYAFDKWFTTLGPYQQYKYAHTTFDLSCYEQYCCK